MKSTTIWMCWREGWGPGGSSSTNSRAREALSVLLSGSAYWGPRGSTIQRNTLTFVSIWSIIWEMWLISCSMALRSSTSRPGGRFGACAWVKSGRLSALAATSLPPPALRETHHAEKQYRVLPPKSKGNTELIVLRGLAGNWRDFVSPQHDFKPILGHLSFMLFSYMLFLSHIRHQHCCFTNEPGTYM